MPVYVDDMYLYPMGQFGRMKMSHMIGTDENELHVMAARIGVARKWYQEDHYDISISRRKLAIEYGAKEITMHQLSAMACLRRFGQRMPPPAIAEAHMKAYWTRIRKQKNGNETKPRPI